MIDSSASQEKQPSSPSQAGNFQEQIITESVTDKLLEPIGVNQQLEKSYEFLELMLRASATTINGRKGNLDEWLTKHLNDYFRDGPRFQEITIKDIGSLTLITENPFLQKFRDIYGYNYRRPVFYLSLKDYRIINDNIHGGMGDGMAISGGTFDKEPITKGLIIIVASSGLTEATKHEIKHTLDPQLTQKRRHGKDQVLEEFAAFWGDVIIPRKVIWKTGQKTGVNEITTTLGSIQLALEASEYIDQYRDFFTDDKEYKDTISEIAEYIHKLQDKYDKFQIDRILMNAVRIADLKECVGEQGLKIQ